MKATPEFDDAQALREALNGTVVGRAGVVIIELAAQARDHAPELKAVAATALVSAGIGWPAAQAAAAVGSHHSKRTRHVVVHTAPATVEMTEPAGTTLWGQGNEIAADTGISPLAARQEMWHINNGKDPLMHGRKDRVPSILAQPVKGVSTTKNMVVERLIKGGTIWADDQKYDARHGGSINIMSLVSDTEKASGVTSEKQAEHLSVGFEVDIPTHGASETHSSIPVGSVRQTTKLAPSGGTTYRDKTSQLSHEPSQPEVINRSSSNATASGTITPGQTVGKSGGTNSTSTASAPITETAPQTPAAVKPRSVSLAAGSTGESGATTVAAGAATPEGPTPQYVVSPTPGTPAVTDTMPPASFPANGIDTDMNPSTSATPALTRAAIAAEITSAKTHANNAKYTDPNKDKSHSHHTARQHVVHHYPHKLKVEPLPAAHPGQIKATPLPAAHPGQIKVYPIANSNHTLECDKNVIHPLIGKLVQEQVIDYFMICNEDSLAAASGIEANLMHESSLDPTKVEVTAFTGGNSTSPYAAGIYGWGIAQWTPGAKVLSAVADYGINTPIQDLQTQLELIAAQMNGHSPTGYADLNATIKDYTSSTLAAAMVDKNFEGPLGGGNEDDREAVAKESAKDFGASALKALHNSRSRSTSTSKHDNYAHSRQKAHAKQQQTSSPSSSAQAPSANSTPEPVSSSAPAPAATPAISSETTTTPEVTAVTSASVSTTSTPTAANTTAITTNSTASTVPTPPTALNTTSQSITPNSTSVSASTATNNANDSGSGQAKNEITSNTEDSEQLAKQILNNPKISLTGTDAEQDIEDAANGQVGSAGVMTAQPILNLINTLGEDHTVSISAIQSGGTGHCLDSDGVAQSKAACPDDPHYNGDAVDIYELDGQPVTGRNAPAIAIMQEAFPVLPSGSGFGQDECGPQYSTSSSLPNSDITFSDTCNHLHIQVPAGT
jgi:tail lysozyme